eukprot:SM000045S16191  [mRNA]  locus=s45:115630:120643:- [translate_table: standard]
MPALRADLADGCAGAGVGAASVSPAQEKARIRELTQIEGEAVSEGEHFYLLSSRQAGIRLSRPAIRHSGLVWWRLWQLYVGGGEVAGAGDAQGPTYDGFAAPISKYSRPPPIDNDDLLEIPTSSPFISGDKASSRPGLLELKTGLVEDKDYQIVPQGVWKELHGWYAGGPAIVRRAILSGAREELQVEVYPLRLQLLRATKHGLNSSVYVSLSRKARVSELVELCKQAFEITSEVLVWDYFGGHKNNLMSGASLTLEDAEIQMNQEILVEDAQQEAGQAKGAASSRLQFTQPAQNGHTSSREPLAIVPVEQNASPPPLTIAGGPLSGKSSSSNGTLSGFGLFSSFGRSTTEARDSDDWTFGSASAKAGPLGIVGLQNLGNTCFMNSALQCLVHTPQLVDFFLGDYSKQINKANPLGMEGELALAFGELLRKLWSPGKAPIAPRAFKTKLARFAPQFSGYNQHDSQELLAFLLDGLHEDLNRVHKKPYIEAKDADGRPDQEVADEYWANHRARNDSIIVDTCQGQYKSTLVCPVCGKVSVTFDPFMYLSLPLPAKSTRVMTVSVYSSTGAHPPSQHTLTVPKQGRYRDLVGALSKACELGPNERLVLTEVFNNRIFRIFEDMNEQLSSTRDDDRLAAYRLPKDVTSFIVVIHRQAHEQSLSNLQHWKQFGTPLLLPYPAEGLRVGSDLYALIRRALRPLINRKRPSADDSGQPRRANAGDLTSNAGRGHTADSQEGLTSEGRAAMEEDETEGGPASEEVSRLAGESAEMDTQPPEGAARVGEDHVSAADEHWERHAFSLWVTNEKGETSELSITPEAPVPLMLSSPGALTSKSRYVAADWSRWALKQDVDAAVYDIPPEVLHSGAPALLKKPRQEAINLYTCLEAFLREEPLGPDDMWYCPVCKEHRQASKKLDLWRLPEILVVHLKRFSYSRYLKNKLDTFINFPIHRLDLSPYVALANGEQHVYSLYAVSNHYGGMGGGHYTAYAKLHSENKWYNFDDSSVSPVSENDTRTSAAYVLFYRRDGAAATHIPHVVAANNSPPSPMDDDLDEDSGYQMML